MWIEEQDLEYAEKIHNGGGYVTDRPNGAARHSPEFNLMRLTEDQSLEAYFGSNFLTKKSKLRKKLRGALKKLTKQQQKVLHYIFIKTKTQKETAKLMKTTQQNVADLLSRTVIKLKKLCGGR